MLSWQLAQKQQLKEDHSATKCNLILFSVCVYKHVEVDVKKTEQGHIQSDKYLCGMNKLILSDLTFNCVCLSAFTTSSQVAVQTSLRRKLLMAQ